MIYEEPMRLSESKKGYRVVLKKLAVHPKIEMHLMNLGLVPGTTLEIILNTANGTVVWVRGGKFALGREIAEALEVDLIHEQRVSSL